MARKTKRKKLLKCFIHVIVKRTGNGEISELILLFEFVLLRIYIYET